MLSKYNKYQCYSCLAEDSNTTIVPVCSWLTLEMTLIEQEKDGVRQSMPNNRNEGFSPVALCGVFNMPIKCLIRNWVSLVAACFSA